VRSVLAAQPVSLNALIIRTVAHRILQQQHESYTDNDFTTCIIKLCALAMANGHLNPSSNWSSYIAPLEIGDQADLISSRYFNQQLLSAVAYFGIMSTARNLCEQGFLHYLHP
jgi:hypothetical protein